MEELAVLQDDRPTRFLVVARRFSALTSRALTAHKLYSAQIPGGYKPNRKRSIDRLRRAEQQKIQKSRFLPNLIQRNSAASCKTRLQPYLHVERVVFGCLRTMSWRGAIGCAGLQLRAYEYTGVR